jgi:tetratricopeptide (TPR) repeat protein
MPVLDAPAGRFFRPIDWKAFWTAFLVSFGVFFYTMAPTVSLEDSGELAVAGDYLGVPHPPGYPIWTMISWLFTKIFWFVTFRGQPNPAWAVTLVSVVFGALACGITAMLICRSGSDLLAESRAETHTADGRTDNLIGWTGGVVGSLLLAFAPVMWSQTTIVEVYSLNAFFLALVFLLTYRWLRRPNDKVLFVAAFVFGLGLTNYQVLLLAVMALMVAVMLKDIDLFRDFLIVGTPFAVILVICNLASQPPMVNFPHLPAYDGEGYDWLLSHTPLSAPPVLYGGILLALTFIVAMAVTARLTTRPGRQPMLPLVLMAAGVLVLLLLLANFPSAAARPDMDSSQVMNWRPYYLAFAAAMGATALLSCSLPGGYVLATALISINLALAVLLRKGGLFSLYHPLSFWFAFYATLNVVVLGLGWLFLPRGRTVAISILMVEFGLSFYAYMPLASDLRNPPMNWAYPRTWEGFKHAITRGQYEKIAPADVFSMEFVYVIGDFLTDLREQFSLPMALLGFLPFTVWQVTIRSRRIRALYLALPLAVAASVLAFAERLFIGEIGLLAPVYKMLSLGILLLLAAGGLALFISQALEMIRKLPGSARTLMPERVTVALVLVGAVGIILLYMTMLSMGALKVLEPLRTGAQLAAGQGTLIMLQAAGLVSLMLIPVLAVILVVWLMDSRHQFRMTIDHASQQWLISTLFGFLAMSLVLIALANPKGDIQDMFIQRVKFISSHALYAFWVGYGLIFGLAFVDTVFRGRRVMTWLAVGVALLLPLMPIHQNANNAEQVRRVGGAEQNGHDFGWQFGNYQLRGADAISEELEEGEEPLPDPTYPPPMGPDAIFYGGTDPGRFVPTYMIYSARVREDVYLITQNALADNTYMSVMRDLYGDQIWIPAQPDSARAFQRYVDEVNSGKRSRNADLTIENGRVQVSGALGVMEINGILAEDIFKRNSYRHDFYVEESYVIPWMYPYLTPHGLIMKINSRQLDLDPALVRSDSDFWDWYTRRLMSDTRFLRDVVARKSFSKLRSAIAGLYASRMRLPDAEAAFHEARMLYPLSPEANFRLVQEVLMRMSRFGEARDLMQDFGRQDPGNTKVPEFVAYLERIEDLTRRIRELETRRTKGQVDIKTALELADLYYQAGQKGLYGEMLRRVLANKGIDPRIYLQVAEMCQRSKDYEEMDTALTQFMANRTANTPPDIYLRIAQMYAAAERPDRMVAPMAEYLKLKPSDWKAWLDQASILMMQKQTEAAVRALEMAIKTGGSEAMAVIRDDPGFAPIQNKALDRSRKLMGIPRGGGADMGDADSILPPESP